MYVVKTNSPASGKGVHVDTWDHVVETAKAWAEKGISVVIERVKERDDAE